jgi:hypothetical protein
MQLPFDWYVHIAPGSLYLLSILLLLFTLTPHHERQQDKPDAMEFIQKNAVAVAPIALILAYMVGLAANTVIVDIIRPKLVSVVRLPPAISLTTQQQLLIDQYADPKLLESYRSGYMHMVFLRSLSFSALVLFVAASSRFGEH